MSSFDLSDESEYVLSVDSPSPAVDRFKPETVFSTMPTSLSSYFTWTVHLERMPSFSVGIPSTLSVRVRIQCKVNVPRQWCDLTVRAIHFVPRHGPIVSTTVLPEVKVLRPGDSVEGTVDVDRVLHNNRYIFDIILTSSTELLRKRIDTITRDEPSEAVTRNSRIMQTLLKDPYSVDIRFVFDADKSYSNVGLWAHRSILAEYKPLADLIQEASSESATQTSSGNDAQGVINAEMLTIPLSDISPATLCVLLRYIYTGEINRTVDTSLHAISTTESALVTKGIAGRPASFVRWSPMDKDSPWRLRDVTWEELLRASSRFGVSELQQRCEDAVIASIDASNVVDVLFTVGNTFGKIKDTAMDFIVEKIGSVVLEDKEPFAAYRNHPDAFDFLVELVRRKAPKAAVTDAA